MLKNRIQEKLVNALTKTSINDTNPDLQTPDNDAFGDYATSIALKYAKKLKKNPLELASTIAKNIPQDEIIEKVEVIKPGFINFWLSANYLISTIKQAVEGKGTAPVFNLGQNKKVIVEYAHPNTHKLFHIGHLRTISTGESIARILEAVGNKVIRANYQGDIGLHIAKCIYKVQGSKFPTSPTATLGAGKVQSLKNLRQKIEYLGKAYAEGNKAYETDEKAKKDIIEVNRMIYEQDPQIMPLWQETRQWSLDYFDEIYKRVYTRFDRLYFESELAKQGKKLSLDALKKGALEKSQGAIVFNGKKYGLDTRVFINSLGFPTYEGKELALAQKEFSEFGEIDKCIHVVSSEQTSFFKVTFKVEELLDPKKYKNKQYHLVYGWVRLKHGKMSSRSGNVIEGAWLIDEAKNRILQNYKCDDGIAEKLAVGAIKYSFLKNATQNEVVFDFGESISLEGNSAPYLNYTYVRIQSILKKDKEINTNDFTAKLNNEEKNLVRSLSQYPEVVGASASNFSPSAIATYLFDISQKYNVFYQKHPVLKEKGNVRNLRLLLTKRVGQVIKNGLYLLGIEVVEKM